MSSCDSSQKSGITFRSQYALLAFEILHALSRQQCSWPTKKASCHIAKLYQGQFQIEPTSGLWARVFWLAFSFLSPVQNCWRQGNVTKFKFLISGVGCGKDRPPWGTEHLRDRLGPGSLLRQAKNAVISPFLTNSHQYHHQYLGPPANFLTPPLLINIISFSIIFVFRCVLYFEEGVMRPWSL